MERDNPSHPRFVGMASAVRALRAIGRPVGHWSRKCIIQGEVAVGTPTSDGGPGIGAITGRPRPQQVGLAGVDPGVRRPDAGADPGLPTAQRLTQAGTPRTTGTQDTPVSLPLFLQGLGSVGVFASRAFLPAFV